YSRPPGDSLLLVFLLFLSPRLRFQIQWRPIPAVLCRLISFSSSLFLPWQALFLFLFFLLDGFLWFNFQLFCYYYYCFIHFFFTFLLFLSPMLRFHIQWRPIPAFLCRLISFSSSLFLPWQALFLLLFLE